MMGAFLYGTALQWRLDIRSRTLLITCYVVPLLFFAMMGGIFTSVNPSAREKGVSFSGGFDPWVSPWGR